METLTYSTVAVTLGLVVARPRVGPRFRLSPAMAALAGVTLLVVLGVVRLADLGWAAATMWRPLVGISSIMVMTGVARRAGVLDGLAELVFRKSGASPLRLFARVFAFGAVTAALLNNDSAILLVTPLVVDAARKRNPKLVVPLAFAVFLSAGVAPLMVSNPMNMVVASFAGIGFNEYAARMALPAACGALVTFVAARALFRRELLAAGGVPSVEGSRVGLSRAQAIILGALAVVVLAYPVVSWLGGPVWIVAAAGAVLLLAVGSRLGQRPAAIAREEIHYDVLGFLFAVFVLSIGMRNVGVVAHLARAYEHASPAAVGAVAALGSAVLNNHPMGHLNMMALEGRTHGHVLAALIGGDLGPRLFPMGSLAGLLWLEMLRRAGVEVGIRRFLLVGAIATLPALAVCLATLL